LATVELTPGGTDPAKTKSLVKRLADVRLVVTSVSVVTKDEEVEVTHEALIRHWPRLRHWLETDRADLRVLASVRLAAHDWQKQQSDESMLTHHGGRLLEAERLRSHPRLFLNTQEIAYLNACKERQERQTKRERRYQRWIAGVSLGGAAIAVLLAAWAL